MNRTIYDIYAKAMLRESVEDPDSYYNIHMIKPGETVNSTTLLAAVGDVMLQCYTKFCEKFGDTFDGSSFDINEDDCIAKAVSRVNLIDFPSIGLVDVNMQVQAFIEEDTNDYDGYWVFFETSVGLDTVVDNERKVSNNIYTSKRFPFSIFEASDPEGFEVNDDLTSIAVYDDATKNRFKELIAEYKKITFNNGNINSAFIQKYLERLLLKMRISAYHKW